MSFNAWFDKTYPKIPSTPAQPKKKTLVARVMTEKLDPMAEEVRPRSIDQLESNARMKATAHMIRHPHTRESINSEEAEQLAQQAREDFDQGLAPQSADDVYMATYNEQSAQLDKAHGMIKGAK